MTDYEVVTGERLTHDDPRIIRVVAGDALPPYLFDSYATAHVDRALRAPVAPEGTRDVVVIYTSGTTSRDDRAVRAFAVRPGRLRLALRRWWRRVAPDVDAD